MFRTLPAASPDVLLIVRKEGLGIRRCGNEALRRGAERGESERHGKVFGVSVLRTPCRRWRDRPWENAEGSVLIGSNMCSHVTDTTIRGFAGKRSRTVTWPKFVRDIFPKLKSISIFLQLAVEPGYTTPRCICHPSYKHHQHIHPPTPKSIPPLSSPPSDPQNP